MFNFHFSDYNNPTRYNIAKQLVNLGSEPVSFNNNKIKFSDLNLILPEVCTINLEYKHKLAKLVETIKPTIMPISYIIDDNCWQKVLKNIEKTHHQYDGKFIDKCNNLIWILKPSMLNNGEHIHLFDCFSKLYQHYARNQRMGGKHVIQHYINRPMLMNSCKFTIRMYVIITNYDGVFMYPHGYFNQCRSDYKYNCIKDIDSHLTNEHLNGSMHNVNQIATDAKLELFHKISPQIENISSKVISEFQKNSAKIMKVSAHKAFDIFGFDFLMDQKGKLWLLEVNHGPHFPTNNIHELTESLYNQFWQALVKEFVIPIAVNKDRKNILYYKFERIAKKSKWWQQYF